MEIDQSEKENSNTTSVENAVGSNVPESDTKPVSNSSPSKNGTTIGSPNNGVLTKLNSPCSNMSQSMACLPTNWSDQQDHFLQLSPPPAFPPPSIPVTNPTNHVNPPSSLKTTIPPSNPMENNPLPLPPKSLTLNR